MTSKRALRRANRSLSRSLRTVIGARDRRAAEALLEVADEWERAYPADVFIPIAPDQQAAITAAIVATGHTRDAVSADVMRHAARLLRRAADEVRA